MIEQRATDGHSRRAGRERRSRGRKLTAVILSAIFLCALILRLIALGETLHGPLPGGVPQMYDAQFYESWAAEIADGNVLGDEAFYLAPLYPYLMAGVYALSGQRGAEALPAVLLFQVFMGSLSCLLLFAIGKRIGGPAAGILAGLMGAVYAPFIYFDTLQMPTSLVLFTQLLSIWLVIRSVERGTIGSLMAAGLALAAAALSHGTALATVLLMAVWLLYSWPAGERPVRWKAAAILLLTAAIPPGLVALRNTVVSGDTVLITSNAGKNFFIGNNSRADGSFMQHALPMWGSSLYDYLSARKRGPTDAPPSEVSREYARRAWLFIREKPRRALWLLGRKALLFFNWFEIPINDNQYFAARFMPLLRAPLLRFSAVAPLGLAGLLLIFRDRRLLPVALIFAGQVACFVIMFILARYRVVAVAMLMILAAVLIQETIRFLQARRFFPVLFLAVAATAAVLVVNLHIPGFDVGRGFSQQHLAVAKVLLRQGRFDSARAELTAARIADMAPQRNRLIRQAEIERELGRIDELDGNDQHALEHYRKAFAILRGGHSLEPTEILRRQRLKEYQELIRTLQRRVDGASF